MRLSLLHDAQMFFVRFKQEEHITLWHEEHNPQSLVNLSFLVMASCLAQELQYILAINSDMIFIH